MSYHHANRVFHHLDNPLIASLSPLERSVLHFITQGINPDNPAQMTFSNAYLADLSGYSENACQRATKALVTKGVLSATRDRRRAATLYALLIECPADCANKLSHYTDLELTQHRERLPLTHSQMVTYPLSDGLPKHSRMVTNKQLTNNLKNKDKNLVEFAERKHQGKEFSFAEFEKILFECDLVTNDHLLVSENPHRAYEVALIVIDQVAAKRPVNSPSGLIRHIYEANPRRLLGGAPGTKPRNPDFIERDRDTSHLTRDAYMVAMNELCGRLGIDYDADLAATTKDRELWKAYKADRLTLALVANAYNSYREPGEWLQPESVNLY